MSTIAFKFWLILIVFITFSLFRLFITVVERTGNMKDLLGAWYHWLSLMAFIICSLVITEKTYKKKEKKLPSELPGKLTTWKKFLDSIGSLCIVALFGLLFASASLFVFTGIREIVLSIKE